MPPSTDTLCEDNPLERHATMSTVPSTSCMSVEPRKQPELSRLLPRHYKILELALEGFDTKEIALAMEMSPVGIGLIINSPLFQDELSRRRKTRENQHDDVLVSTAIDAQNTLQKAANLAAQTQVGLLSSEDPRVQLQAASAVLDRVLEKKSSGSQGVLVLGVDALKLLEEALSESRTGRAKHVEAKMLMEEA